MVSVPYADVSQTVDAVWRMEAAKIVATLTRAVGDVALAEDLAQEALLDALAQWPNSGVPRNPAAWLIFVAAHPSLSRENQIALTLRVAGGSRRHLSHLFAQRPGRTARADGSPPRGGRRVRQRRRNDHQRQGARRAEPQGNHCQSDDDVTVRAVMFDFSGTLFRLEEDDSWFAGIEVDEQAVDGHVQAELMRRLTAPTGRSVDMNDEQYRNWINRDLEPHLHREAYLHVLRESGVADHHAEKLYELIVDPACWTPYPDTAAVLPSLRRNGIRVALVSNIAFDLRPAFEALGALGDVDEFALSFEVGAVKPDPEIFQTALTRLGVSPVDALMVGDSEEADGGARALGCRFALVDPLPTDQRPNGLIDALAAAGASHSDRSAVAEPSSSRRALAVLQTHRSEQLLAVLRSRGVAAHHIGQRVCDGVELLLDGVIGAGLGVLQQRDEKKGDDRREGVDDQLPGVQFEYDESGRPDHDDRHTRHEEPGFRHPLRDRRGEFVEGGHM